MIIVIMIDWPQTPPVQGFGFRVQGLGFRVQGSGAAASLMLTISCSYIYTYIYMYIYIYRVYGFSPRGPVSPRCRIIIISSSSSRSSSISTISLLSLSSLLRGAYIRLQRRRCKDPSTRRGGRAAAYLCYLC